MYACRIMCVHSRVNSGIEFVNCMDGVFRGLLHKTFTGEKKNF